MQNKPNCVKIHFIKIIVIALVLIQVVWAQTGPPNSSETFEEINDVPIDGAIALLSMLGIGYGIKTIYNSKPNQ